MTQESTEWDRILHWEAQNHHSSNILNWLSIPLWLVGIVAGVVWILKMLDKI